MINGMKDQMATAAGSMQSQRQSLGELMNGVDSTLKAIEDIVRYVESVTGMVQRTAQAAEEQSATLTQVSRGIANISDIARRLKQTAASAKSLSQGHLGIADHLGSAVEWFRTT